MHVKKRKIREGNKKEGKKEREGQNVSHSSKKVFLTQRFSLLLIPCCPGRKCKSYAEQYLHQYRR